MQFNSFRKFVPKLEARHINGLFLLIFALSRAFQLLSKLFRKESIEIDAQ